MFSTASNVQINSHPQKVAILGTTPLALFLAARFNLAGQNVTLITPPQAAEQLATIDFSLKEDRNLLHHRFRFQSNYKLADSPDILIIAADRASIRAHLPLLSPHLLAGVPVLNFNNFADTSCVAAYLRAALIPAYFNGYINLDKNQILSFSKQTSVTLSLNETERGWNFINHQLTAAGIDAVASPDNNSNFWLHFIPFAATSLLSGLRHKNIYLLLKDERERKLLDQMVEELIGLAAADNTFLTAAEMMPKIYGIPAAYSCKIQENDPATVTSELGLLSDLLLQHSEASGQSIPVLRQLLADFYNKILA